MHRGRERNEGEAIKKVKNEVKDEKHEERRTTEEKCGK